MAWDAPLPGTWVVIGLVIATHVATAGLQWYQGYAGALEALLLPRSSRFRADVGGQFAPYVERGELWRLATSVVLHADALHLAINGAALASLGRVLEPWIGTVRFLGWFVAGGLAGAAATHLAGILQSDGSSGGAFALLGAIVVLAWRRRADLDPAEWRLLGPVMLVFLAVNLVVSAVLPFVNVVGHLGGLAAGLALARAWRPEGPTWRWTPVLVGFAGAVVYGAWRVAT